MGKSKTGKGASKARSTTKTKSAASAKASSPKKSNAKKPAAPPKKAGKVSQPAQKTQPKPGIAKGRIPAPPSRAAKSARKADAKSSGASRSAGSTSDRTLAELAARWPVVSDAEREAFASLISDTQADELGRRTKASEVRDEATRWAVIIDGALRSYPGALESYAPRRFAYMLSVARELSTVIASEDQRRGHVGDVRGVAVDARDSALQARNATIERLTTFAGQRGAERASLAQASGLADPVELLIRSLRALAHLEIDWVERMDPASQVLAESAGLSLKDAAGLRAHAEALSAKRVAQSLEGRAITKDTPTMNRVEGRLLFEMREVRRIFATAHAKNAVIPNLIPGPGVRAVIGKRAASAPNAPQPEAPETSASQAGPSNGKSDGVSAAPPN